MSWNIAKPGDQINGPVAVTGDLNVDSNTLFVDSVNNRVGVLTATPAASLQVGTRSTSILSNNSTILTAGGASASAGTTVAATFANTVAAAVGNEAQITFTPASNYSAVGAIGVAIDSTVSGSSSTKVYTYDGTGLTERLKIAGNGVCTWSNVGGVAGTAMTLNGTGLGVGGSIFSNSKLTLVSAAGVDCMLALQKTGGSNTSVMMTDGTNAWLGSSSGSTGKKLIYALAAPDNSVVIDSSGNVGIGTASPSVKVQVDNNGQSEVRIRNTSGSGIAALALVAGAQQSNPWYLYADSSRNLIFQDGGSERARIDSTGNLGLGVAPSAWQANWKVLQFANGSSIGNPYNGEGTFVGSNAYRNSSGDYIRLDTGYAAMYMQLSGSHRWHVAGSSTAGSTIPSFSPGSQAMTLDASGRLSVGGSPTGTAKFEIQGTTVGERILFSQTANNTAARTMFSIGYRSGGTNTTGYNAIVCATETQFDDSYGVKILSGPSSAVGIHLNKDGRVGIGMADSMLNRAQIQGAGQATATVSDNGDGSALFLSDTGAAANNGGLLFLGSASANGQRPHVGIKSLLTDATANGTGDMAFLTRTTTGATTLTEKMRLTRDGFLGVGMTPVAPLSVRNSIGGFLFNFDRNSGAKLRLECDTDAAGTGALLYVVNSAASAYQPLRIDASVIRLKPNGIESMTIKGGGQTRFVPLASAPASPEAGDVYYDSSTNKLRCYNGTTWNDLF